MKWLAKYVKRVPADGDYRLYRRFAWAPIYIDGVIVWLSKYEIIQVYRITEQKVKINGEIVAFLPGNWVNIAKRCK